MSMLTWRHNLWLLLAAADLLSPGVLGAREAPRVSEVAAGARQVQERFDRGRGKVRLLLLLSPG